MGVKPISVLNNPMGGLQQLPLKYRGSEEAGNRSLFIDCSIWINVHSVPLEPLAGPEGLDSTDKE